MAILRAMAILKHASGLARDNAVNTFHFTGDSTPAVHQAIVNAVSSFYRAIPPNVTKSVSAYLSPRATTLDINIYEIPGTLTDGKETPAGPPVFVSLGNANNLNVGVDPKVNNVPLPQEVAVCVSYQGTPGAGVVQARRRGRIYIGPLNQGAADTAVTGDSRPADGIRNVLAEAYINLAQDIDADAELVVYSRPYPGRDAIPRVDRPDLPALPPRPATTVNIDQVWVDNEFDTMRKRGLQRTGRTLISTGEA